MDFQEFLQYVPKLIQAKLPAFDAHVKMAPLERLDSLRSSNIANKKPRTAAVMMLFYPKNYICFTFAVLNTIPCSFINIK